MYRGANHGKLITSSAPYTSHPFSVDCVSLSYSDSGMWGLSVTAHGDEVLVCLFVCLFVCLLDWPSQLGGLFDGPVSSCRTNQGEVLIFLPIMT